MPGRIPVLAVSIQSSLYQEFVRDFVANDCNLNCRFADPTHEQLDPRQPIISVYDFMDFVAEEDQFKMEDESQPTEQPEQRFIIINVPEDKEDLLARTKRFRDIRGIFYEDDGLAIFQKGLQAIFRGEVWVPRRVLVDWVDCSTKKNTSPAESFLSSREASVIRLVVAGLSNKEISEQLHISTNTVKAHLYNIYKKIDVSSRMQAARWASEHLENHRRQQFFTATSGL